MPIINSISFPGTVRDERSRSIHFGFATPVTLLVWYLDDPDGNTAARGQITSDGTTNLSVTVNMSDFTINVPYVLNVVVWDRNGNSETHYYPGAVIRNPVPTGSRVVIETTAGTIRDEQNRTISYYFRSSANHGIANRFHIQVKNLSTSEYVRDSYRLQANYSLDESNPVKPTMQLGYSSMPFLTECQLIITPCFYDSATDTTYEGASSTQGTQRNIYRNPTPINNNAIEMETSSSRQTRGSIFRSDKVFYYSSQSNGTANYCEFTLSDGNNHSYSVIQNIVTGYYWSGDINISSIPSAMIGMPLSLTVTPLFKSGSTTLRQATKTYSNYFVFDAGILNPTILNPAIEYPKWFFEPTTTADMKSLFLKIELPIDVNYQYLSAEEKSQYRYSTFDLGYKVYKNGSIIRSQIISIAGDVQSNAILGNVTYIHHNETISLSLGEILKVNAINLRAIEADSIYFALSVTSPYGSRSPMTDKMITLVDLPIHYDKVSLSGQPVTAELLLGYLQTEKMLSDWTGTEYKLPTINQLRGQKITYDSLYGLRDEVRNLYNLTADLNTSNKYIVPLDIMNDNAVAPNYELNAHSKDAGLYDYVYNNTRASGVSLDELYVEPVDYSTNYNAYFKKDPDQQYVWRSTDANFDTDMVFASFTGDYNVFYSYYMLIYCLIADYVESEPIEEYISGTLAGKLSVHTDTVTNYSFSALPNLRRIVLDETISELPANAFFGGTNIIELILLYPGVVSVPNRSAIQPLADKTVRVPADQVTNYQNDNNWGYSSYHINFVAL